MGISSQLGDLALGLAQLGSDGALASPSLTWDNNPSSGNAGANATFVVTYNNPGVDVTWTVTSDIVGDVITRATQTTSVANPVLDFELTGPAALGDHVLSITNDGGLSNPADLVYTVLAVSGQTSMLGALNLGSARLGADAGAFVAGAAQLYLRPAAVMHGRAGVQSGAIVVGILNPPAGDTHVVMSNVGLSGTWDTAPTLNNDTREAIVYFTSASGTSGQGLFSATADNGVLPPPESLTYTVDGNAFFVSAAGSDSNNGQSQLTPWQTPAKAQSYGLASVRGGALAFRGADVFLACALLLSDGNAGASLTDLITITSYGTGKAVLKNTSPTVNPITVTNSGGVKILNVIGEGSGAGSSQGAFFFGGSNAATIQNLSVDGCECRNAFIGVAFSHNSAVASPSINATWLHDCLLSGTFFGATAQVGGTYRYTDVSVTGCTYEDIDGNTTGIGNQQSVAAYFIDCNRVTLSGSLIRRISATTVHGGGVVVCGHCVAVVVSGCEAHEVTGPVGEDAGGINFDWSCTDCIAELNLLTDMDGAGLMAFEYQAGSGVRLSGAPAWSNNTYRFNVLQRCGRSHFGAIGLFGDSMAGAKFYHNTVITEAGGGNCQVYFGDVSGIYATNITAMYVLNNIFLSDTTAVKVTNLPATSSTNAEQHWLNNAYYSMDAGTPDVDWLGSSYGSIAAWQAATGQDANAITGNPALNDPFAVLALGNPALIGTLSNFTPTAGSPVVGTGLDLTQAPYSYGGIVNAINNRPASQGGAYDIGAAKFISSVEADVVAILSGNQEVIA